MKKSLVVYHDYLETLFGVLSDAEVGQLLVAVIKFDMKGEITEFTDRAMVMAYKRMINDCERNQEKYANTCEKNRVNARKRWTSNGNDCMRPDATGCDRIRTDAMDADNDNDNDNVNDNDKDNVNDIPVLIGNDGAYHSLQEAELNIDKFIALKKVQGKLL